MTDRELLELAAKAADYQFSTSMRSLSQPPVPVILAESGRWKQWDPLHDDGDALRLAVKLNLDVQIDFNEEEAKVYIYGGWVGEGIEEELGELDRYQATRRAITRAAAEIGRQME